MSYHLINPGGRMVAIDSEEEYKKFKAVEGFKEPTQDEIDNFIKIRYSMTSNMVPKDEGRSDVYMATVTQGGKDGYGRASGHLLEELQKIGTKISLFNKHQKIGLLFHAPYSVARLEHPVKIIYTMFESDKIPDDWLEFLQAADKVLVPSKWCAEVFAKSGINTEVVPLGYDDSVFKYKERHIKRIKNEDFVFLHYNAFNIRKGFLEVLKAFMLEFKPDEPVKMLFKTTLTDLPPILPSPSQYPNIIVERGPIEDRELAELCERADCFVFPSRGEGFGITPLEAMATGMPAIVPNAHGISEYFNPEYMYEVKVEKKCPAIYARYKGINVGEMVICDVDDLRRQMRYVYEHQNEAIEMGRKASEYVKNWTYEKTAEKLKVILDDYLSREVTEKPLNNILVLEEVS